VEEHRVADLLLAAKPPTYLFIEPVEKDVERKRAGVALKQIMFRH